MYSPSPSAFSSPFSSADLFVDVDPAPFADLDPSRFDVALRVDPLATFASSRSGADSEIVRPTNASGTSISDVGVDFLKMPMTRARDSPLPRARPAREATRIGDDDDDDD